MTPDPKYLVDYFVCANCGVPVCLWYGKTWRHNPGGRKGLTCGKRAVAKIDGKGVVTGQGIKRVLTL